jgi:hypothetical protein
VAQAFAAQGIGREALHGAMLAELYARLQGPGQSTVDQELADGILRMLPPGGAWGGATSAVIVETRDIPQLAYVIGNVIQQTGLPVQLFHSAANRQILKGPELAGHVRQGLLASTELPPVRFTTSIYDLLLLDPRFYRAMQGRGRFLLFQTDSLCCPGADFRLGDFAGYDYVGAAWNENRPIGLTLRGGCGGFSFRSWEATMDVLARFSPAAWPGGEDSYFAFHLDLAGYRVATAEVAAKFATQDFFLHRSFGAHLVALLPPDARMRFVQYCPEIRNVLRWQPMGVSRNPDDVGTGQGMTGAEPE